MVAAAVDSARTGPPHLGEPCSRMAATPLLTAAICMMGPLRGLGCASTTTVTAARPPDASHHAYSFRETGRPPAAIEPIAVGGNGSRR
jgi:hypothetical protein